MILLWWVYVSTLRQHLKDFFTSPCSSNWIGMYFIATIDKSHWKRIELITSSASKVHVRATHSGVPEWRWNVHHKVDLKCSNTAMVQSTMSLWNLLSLLFCRPFCITTWPLKKKKKNLREKERTQSSLSQISVFGFCLDQSYRRQNDMPKIVFGLDWHITPVF